MPFFFWIDSGSGSRSLAVPVITVTVTAVEPTLTRPGSTALTVPVITVTATAFPPTILVTALAGRDWDVLEAARDLLLTTNNFDHIYLSSQADRSPSTEDSFWAELQLLDWTEGDEFMDDNGAVVQLRKTRWTLNLFGRDNDAEVRDRRLDLLLNFSQNMLDGRSLATVTLPGLTKLGRAVWKKPDSPTRNVLVTGEFSYLIADDSAHNLDGEEAVSTSETAGLPERDWGVLEAARDRLLSTQIFDNVYMTSLADRSPSTEDVYWAELQLLDWLEMDDRDDDADVEQLHKARWTLTLCGRDDDPEIRDRRLDYLSNYSQNVLDGQSLAALTLPCLTKLDRGVWKKPDSPARSLVLTGEFSYLVSDWDTHDTNE